MQEPVYTFVDVETTGGSPQSHRIIDIALIQVCGGKIIREFQSLVQPSQPVSQFIAQLTGITDAMLEGAPAFEEIAMEVASMLEGTIFVAHNAPFDYAFVKQECARAGFSVNLPQLCTVRLSRALFPEERKHNLDIVIERCGIQIGPTRHRAYTDTKAIVDFFLHVHERFPIEVLDAVIKKLLKKYVLPSHMQEEDLEKLPERPGIYIFRDKDGQPIYIGKSIHIRERVCQHFARAHNSSKELLLTTRTHSIDYEETVSELGALLLESTLVKEMLPVYNHRLRRNSNSIALMRSYDAHGYLRPEPRQLGSLESREFSEILGIFRSQRQMKTSLTVLQKELGLCSHLLGLTRGDKACFAYSLGRCLGPCVGEAIAENYNMRVEDAFMKTRIHRWPHKYPLLIRHDDPERGRVEFVAVHEWCVLVHATLEGDEWTRVERHERRFDRDMYHILRSFFRTGSANAQLIPLIPGRITPELAQLLEELQLEGLIATDNTTYYEDNDSFGIHNAKGLDVELILKQIKKLNNK